jgi:hypothetical protein
VLEQPASPQVARLLGIENMHLGRAAGPGAIETDGVVIEAGRNGLHAGEPVTWCIRSNQVRVGADGELWATVVDAVDLPTVREATLQLAPGLTLVVRDPGRPLTVGDRCRVTIPADSVHAWPANGLEREAEIAVSAR